MELNSEIVKQLIEAPKYLVFDKVRKSEYDITPTGKFWDQNYDLECDYMDIVISLHWSIKQGKKGILKLSLHHYEDQNKIGIFRIDINGGHRNPETIRHNLPDKFKPFAGKQLDGTHVHYFVDGYKPLAWALPIENSEYYSDNFNNFEAAIKEFAKIINLQNKIIISKHYGTNLLNNNR